MKHSFFKLFINEKSDFYVKISIKNISYQQDKHAFRIKKEFYQIISFDLIQIQMIT